MFADYANLFFKRNDLGVLYATINIDLAKMSQWFRINKLSLNVQTNYIVFRIKTLQ